MEDKKKVTQPKASKFSKEQILSSDKYLNRRDALSVCLEDKDYTIEEVDKTLDRFMKGKVK